MLKPKQINIQDMRLLDDAFFAAAMQNCIPAAEALLHCLCGDASQHVIRSQIQDFLPNLQGRAVNCDLVIHSSDGTVWIIEVQRSRKGSKPQRSRYIASAWDHQSLPKGTLWNKLSRLRIVFITESDSIGNGEPVNYYPRKNQIFNDILADDLVVMYVNCSYKGKKRSGLDALIHDMKCKDPEAMYIPAFRERCSELKNTRRKYYYV